MSEHPKREWSESEAEGFREIFLAHVSKADDQQALRRLGSMLFEFALTLRDTEDVRTEPFIYRDLSAASRDLRHHGLHLSWLAAVAGEVAGLPPGEATRLTRLARTASATLLRLAASLAGCGP